MGSKIRKPHEQKSVLKKYLDKKSEKKVEEDDDCFVVSFKHYDNSQGANLYEWQEKRMLAEAIDVLSSYCQRPLAQQFSEKFAVYGDFPSRSNYTHPSHVPQDANWARIHINGLHIIAGHIFRNTFYVVFLDNDHTFYITEKKNT